MMKLLHHDFIIKTLRIILLIPHIKIKAVSRGFRYCQSLREWKAVKTYGHLLKKRKSVYQLICENVLMF